MDISHYLGRADWLIGAVAFVLIGLLGLGILRVLEVLLAELGKMIHGFNSSVADALLGLREIPEEPWACSVCGSVNVATTDVCYHACGSRADVSTEAALPARAVIDRLDRSTRPSVLQAGRIDVRRTVIPIVVRGDDDGSTEWPIDLTGSGSVATAAGTSEAEPGPALAPTDPG